MDGCVEGAWWNTSENMWFDESETCENHDCHLSKVAENYYQRGMFITELTLSSDF